MPTRKELQVVITAKNRTGDAFKNVSKQLKKLALAAAAAMAALGVLAVKTFADFEKGMSNVRAITQASQDDFHKLTQLAKEMGRTTAFTAKEASDAMTFLGMAGFSTDQIMQSLRGTMNLAAAANIELGRAADVASNVLTGFRLDAASTERVVDVLAKTITTSNTDMEQLSEAMKYFAPTASAFGVSVEEASAAVGLLGNAGIQGSLATRALGTGLVRLAKPTNDMSEMMGVLGLRFFDAKGQFIGMTGLVRHLEDRFQGMTDQQRQAAIATIFGAEAMQEINVLLAAGSEQLESYTKQLEEAGGTAQKMADEQLDNLTGSITLLKSAVSGLLIEMGEPLAYVIRAAADGLTAFLGVVTKAGGLVNFLRDTLARLMGFIEEKTGLITALKMAWENVSAVFRENLLPELEKLWIAMQPLKPYLIAFAKVLAVAVVGSLHLLIKAAEIATISLVTLLEWWTKLNTFVTKIWVKTIETVTRLMEPFVLLLDKAISAVSRVGGAAGSVGAAFRNLPANLGFSGARASGGPVSVGKSYLVGERGPELFTPGTSGLITPNQQLATPGNVVVNLNVGSIDNSLDAADVARTVGDEIMKRIQLNMRLAQ